jgi:hypothetical protein
MNINNLHIAEVYNNNDTLKEGRIKIYIESMMEGFTVSDYPYARPFIKGVGGDTNYGVLQIPRKNSKVWVFCENPDLMSNWFYLADVSLKTLNPFKKIVTFLSTTFSLSNTTGGLGLTSSYPDVEVKLYPSGVYVGVSIGDDPELFMYHPKGTFISINSDGDITTKSSSTWTHYGDVLIKEGELKVDKEITAMNEIESNKVTLSEHIHTSGSPGTPTTPPESGT